MGMSMAEFNSYRANALCKLFEAQRRAKRGTGRVGKAKQLACTHPFVLFCQSHGIPSPVPEYGFYATRRWRFDWAWPEYHVALEVEGGIWTGGRHTRGKGFANDMEKYNKAAITGWRVLRVVPKDLCTQVVSNMLLVILPLSLETAVAK